MRTLLGLIPVVIFLVLATHDRFDAGLQPDDEGYVALRVAENLRSGHGLIFNAGERRDLIDSPLWVGILSLLSFSSAAPTLLQILGLLLGLLTVLLILIGPRWRLMGVAAALFVGMDGLFMSRLTAGGSDGLTALYLLVLYLMVKGARTRSSGLTELDLVLAVWTALAALFRYELVLVAIPVALGAGLRDPRRRQAWIPLATSVAAAGILLALRWLYFKDWPSYWEPWPATRSSVRLAFQTFVLLLVRRPLLLLGLGIFLSEWFRNRLWLGRRIGLAWGLTALVLFSFAPAAGEDVERQFAAALPLAYLLAVDAVSRGVRTRLALVAALLLLVAQPGWTAAQRTPTPELDAAYVRLGQWLQTHALPGTVIGAERVGALGYYSHMKVEDVAGRISPRVASARRRLLAKGGQQATDFQPMFVQEPDLVLVLPGNPVPSSSIYVPADEAVPEAIRGPYRIYRWAGSPVWMERPSISDRD